MARQKGTIQIEGTIGDLTFFKSTDGFMVKAKSSVAKSKIMSDPKFARTRENMEEFGNAGTSAKHLRTPFSKLVSLSSDPRMVSRLTAQCLKVLHTDTTGKRGKRVVSKGDLSLLANFEFNNKGILSTTFLTPYEVTFVRTTGAAQVVLPVFTPGVDIAAPQGATHYQLQAAAAPIDFDSKKNKAVIAASAVLPWDNDPATELTLSMSLPANSTLPVFVLLQVQFMVQLNADFYSLQNGAYNACAIALVDTP